MISLIESHRLARYCKYVPIADACIMGFFKSATQSQMLRLGNDSIVVDSAEGSRAGPKMIVVCVCEVDSRY